MPEIGFHFDQPWWLLALLLLLPVAAWLRHSRVQGETGRIGRYADGHLMPHLTGSRELMPQERRQRLRRWMALWVLLVLAMAGPRWDYTEIKLFTPGADLVILLDISKSMEVADVSPSRLARAKQEIEDIVNQNPGLRLGLIAFATVAHVISPLTEDGEAVRAMLPAISTDMVTLPGSRLSEALARAKYLLNGQPKESTHSILLISDGDFPETSLAQQVKELAAQGIKLHVLGVGTPTGGPVPLPNGGFVTDPRTRNLVNSPLDENGLRKLAEAGGGTYQSADFLDGDTAKILRLALADSKAEERPEEKVRIWNERYFWLVLPVMLLILPAFRRVRNIEAEVAE